jgi:hypothetical protein
LPAVQPMERDGAQTFLSAGSLEWQAEPRLPVPCFRSGTGDWKVASSRRLESLRYCRNAIRLRILGLTWA